MILNARMPLRYNLTLLSLGILVQLFGEDPFTLAKKLALSLKQSAIDFGFHCFAQIVAEDGSPLILLAAFSEDAAADWIFRLCQAVAETVGIKS